MSIVPPGGRPRTPLEPIKMHTGDSPNLPETLPEYCKTCYLCHVTLLENPIDPDLLLHFPWAAQAYCQTCRIDLFYCRFCRLPKFLHDTGELCRHDVRVNHGPLLLVEATALRAAHSEEESNDAAVSFDPTESPAHHLVENSPTLPDPPQVAPPPFKIFRKSPSELHGILRSNRSENPYDFLKYTMSPIHQGGPTAEQTRKARFFAEEHDRKGSGLISMAARLFTPVCQSAPTEMSLSWFLFGILLSTLLLEVSSTHQSSISFLLTLLAAKLSPDGDIPVALPRNARQSKTYYVNYNDREKGQPSLIEEFNLQRPESLSDGHVYYSLTTTVQFVHALGQVLEPSFLIDLQESTVYQSTFLHSATPRSWELLRASLIGLSLDGVPPLLHPSNISQVKRGPSTPSVTYIIGLYNLIFWSDSFEAFSTKQNRGSVWVLFCSIATPSSSPCSVHNTFNSGKNTFLVAIGPSGKSFSHNCVWSRLLSDLNLLNNHTSPLVTYSRFHRKECHSIFPPLLILQDTPERTEESNGLASWKSNTNVLYGHSATVVEQQHRLPSCRKCFSSRLYPTTQASTSNPQPPCNDCLDWDVREVVPITYAGLKAVVEGARHSIKSGNLTTRVSVVTFLRAAGISPSLSNEIGLQLLQQPDSHIETPALWEYGHLIDVNDSIEVVMHLLFLGIVRSLAKDTVYSFLSSRKQWSGYVDRVRSLFSRIGGLGIYWMKLHPMSKHGSFGGWVSENYLAYSRISKYLGALTESLPATDNPYEDPKVPPSAMTMAQLQRWILSRGMKVSRPAGQARPRKADYIQTVVRTGWKKPGDHPQVKRNPSNGVPLSLFEELVVSCHTMVSQIMGVGGVPSPEVTNEIRAAIKIYLSFDHEFHTWDGRPLPPLARVTGHPTVQHDLAMNNVLPFSSATTPANSAPVCPEDEDDSGSISDDSCSNPEPEGTIDGLLPNQGAAYRIPAVAKRNKLNLLKVPETLARYGSYQFLSELGPKGEGAIQTVKPVVKKTGGIGINDWALHVARGWSSRRFARHAIALVVDAMKARANVEDAAYLAAVEKAFSQYMVADNEEAGPSDPQEYNDCWTNEESLEGIGQLADSVLPSPTDALRRRMFYVYRSREDAISKLSHGIDPISLLVVSLPVRENHHRNSGDTAWFALAYRDSNKMIRLIRVLPTDLVTTRCGAAFFRWTLYSWPGSKDHDDNLLSSQNIQDYGLMLPLSATYSGLTTTVYYTITYGWKEMLADRTIGRYRRQP